MQLIPLNEQESRRGCKVCRAFYNVCIKAQIIVSRLPWLLKKCKFQNRFHNSFCIFKLLYNLLFYFKVKQNAIMQ